MAPERVSFLIVGSPRSGTTLVQRLAGELPGVRVPFETHFFTKGLDCFEAVGGFPLDRRALACGLEAYCELPALEGSGLDADAVADRLGNAGAVRALDVFDAVVREAAGPTAVLGEKTPGHLAWAGRLTALRPELRVIGVVRDPRAVIASRRGVPWGGTSSVTAQAARWLDATRQIVELADRLGSRMLVLRYEDVVAAPDRARAAIAIAIGTPISTPVGPTGGPGAAPGLVWERWKARAGGPVTEDRVEHWRTVLRPSEAVAIIAVTAPVLDRFGYGGGRTRPGTALSARVRSLRDAGTRRAVELRLATLHARVERADLGVG